ncbi:MAG: pyridoxal-dependent decarboxylase [Verrucomicrobiota bacterium]
MAAYPEGPELLEQLRAVRCVPSGVDSLDAGLDPLLVFSAALSKNWEVPESVENVVTLPADPAICGMMLGTIANPNLVHYEYSGMAVELEQSVIRQIATQVGWDSETATGIFTQGGTFCNLYGYLLGIRKNMPLAREYGLEHGLDYRIINSQGGHYSNTTNLSLLGVNLRRKTIRIRITDDNDMDMEDLERQLSACFQLGCVVPTIMLTMGTTDTFGVDRVKPVRDLCDRLCAAYEINAKPHIHVDSAVGWPLVFFLEYDFTGNPLGINESTLAGLHHNTMRFRELRHADSFTVDFQKWGYVPYTSSLVMIRDEADLKALEHDPENFSYFEKDTEGRTHLHSTIECSRGGSGVFGAAAALAHLGVQGYQLLVANSLQNAGFLRHLLMRERGVKCVATANHGPSVGFRLYDAAAVEDADAEFACELNLQNPTQWEERVSLNNQYHRAAFKRRGKVALYTSYVQSIAHTHYDEHGHYRLLAGEKAVFMNPLTTYDEISRFVARLHG